MKTLHYIGLLVFMLVFNSCSTPVSELDDVIDLQPSTVFSYDEDDYWDYNYVTVYVTAHGPFPGAGGGSGLLPGIYVTINKLENGNKILVASGTTNNSGFTELFFRSPAEDRQYEITYEASSYSTQTKPLGLSSYGGEQSYNCPVSMTLGSGSTPDITPGTLQEVICPFGLTGGIWRSGSSANGPSFVRAGTIVQVGDALGTILHYGISNTIESDYYGQVVHILVDSGERVVSGQVLMIIEAM